MTWTVSALPVRQRRITGENVKNVKYMSEHARVHPTDWSGSSMTGTVSKHTAEPLHLKRPGFKVERGRVELKEGEHLSVLCSSLGSGR